MLGSCNLVWDVRVPLSPRFCWWTEVPSRYSQVFVYRFMRASDCAQFVSAVPQHLALVSVSGGHLGRSSFRRLVIGLCCSLSRFPSQKIASRFGDPSFALFPCLSEVADRSRSGGFPPIFVPPPPRIYCKRKDSRTRYNTKEEPPF